MCIVMPSWMCMEVIAEIGGVVPFSFSVTVMDPLVYFKLAAVVHGETM